MPTTVSELEQQNPNVRSQIEVWQRERANNGQSPADWEAFRQHAMAIGAPDPGQEAPAEFMQSAAAVGSSASSVSPSGQQTYQQPQQTYQQPQGQQTYQQPQQQAQDPAVLEAIRIKRDYEADKDTPTDKWLKARGMTKAQLDAALQLAASAEGRY